MELQIQQLKKICKHHIFWVLIALSSLATLHLYYIWKMSERVPSLLDGLGWASIGFLLWNRRSRIKFRGSLISSILGLILIFWMMIRHSLSQSYLSKFDVLSGLFPVITITGILLVSIGFRRLKNYKSEILIATLISIPYASLYNILKPIINIDAQLLNFMLHYIGFQSARQNAIVSLPNGSVEIMPSCSSLVPILTMLPFIVTLLNIYPVAKIKQFYIYISTIFAIVIINSIRLSSLAILLNNGDINNFNYWHIGGGAGIFSNFIVFLVGGIAYQIINNSYKSNQGVLDVKGEL